MEIGGRLVENLGSWNIILGGSVLRETTGPRNFYWEPGTYSEGKANSGIFTSLIPILTVIIIKLN